MKKLSSLLIGFLGIAACGTWLAGCNTNGCLENRSSVPLAGFYSSADDKSVSLDSLQITGIGVPAGQPLYSAGTKLSQVYLPMRSGDGSTSWEIAYKYRDLAEFNLRDTITFDYTSTPYFASSECGVVYHYNITAMRFTKHIIDDVVITDSLVTNTDIERIKIYFRTD